jgi:hypothetical protein
MEFGVSFTDFREHGMPVLEATTSMEEAHYPWDPYLFSSYWIRRLELPLDLYPERLQVVGYEHAGKASSRNAHRERRWRVLGAGRNGIVASGT